MSQLQVARRYAEAFADAASDKDSLPQIAAEFGAFARMVDESKELRQVIESPTVGADQKMKVVIALASQMGVTATTGNFLKVLVRSGRIYLVRAIDKALATELDRRSGIVAADVTTAKPLSQAEKDVLAAKLGAMTGMKVKLQFETDERLIGGVVTRIGSKIYDGSIRAKLDAVKRRMAGDVSA